MIKNVAYGFLRRIEDIDRGNFSICEKSYTGNSILQQHAADERIRLEELRQKVKDIAVV